MDKFRSAILWSWIILRIWTFYMYAHDRKYSLLSSLFSIYQLAKRRWWFACVFQSLVTNLPCVYMGLIAFYLLSPCSQWRVRLHCRWAWGIYAFAFLHVCRQQIVPHVIPVKVIVNLCFELFCSLLFRYQRITMVISFRMWHNPFYFPSANST
jgi:hypothetical protein